MGARRLISAVLVLLCAIVCGLALTGAPALAAAPVVEGETFTDVGSGSAELTARVNAEGSLSEYFYEYATATEYAASSTYGSMTPATSFGAGQETLGAPAQLNGLQPNTEYDFRIVVTNTNGETTDGPNATFKTLPKSLLGLPDGRVYERVSPVEDGQAEVYTPAVYENRLPRSEGIFTENVFAVSTEGDSVVYQGAATVGGKSEGNAYLATRSASGGWRQSDIEPAGSRGADYFAFSSNLSTGFIEASSEVGLDQGVLPLSPEAPGEGHWIPYEHGLESESYQPLITKSASLHRGEELHANYAGSSADLSQVFFGANDALTKNAAEIDPFETSRPGAPGIYVAENLYESVDGRLSLVNVLPNETTEPNAVFGAPCISHHGPAFCFEPHEGSRTDQLPTGEAADLSRVVSADGSRVFWTDLDTGDLYVREDPSSGDARTVQVDASIGGHGRFWTASVTGSKVFFTKGSRDFLGEPDGELYEYELESGRTNDLTPGVEVVGVIGASENAEYLYYVESNNKLELWHDGTSTFLATLSTSDGGEEEEPISPYQHPAGDWYANLGERTAEVTPEGNALVFMSNQSLAAVGYPNGPANGGMEEVYVYEAEDGGRLFCASCSPSGEAPPVGSYGAAAFVPVSWHGTYQPQVISDDGSRVFFDSAEPLVPQDTNGKLDVYEWERDGAGSCAESTGCIYLLSGGQDGSSSWLLGSSGSGDDVFLASRAPLVAGDPYDAFAVYDARVGGVQSLVPPACSGTGCQGLPPAPPIFATPASVTFAGVGNFPAPLTSKTSTLGKGKPKPKAKAKSLTQVQKLARALKACKKKRGDARVVCRSRERRRYAARAGAGKSSIRVGR